MEWFFELTTRAEFFLGVVHFTPVVKFVMYLFTAMAVGIFGFFIFTLITLAGHQVGSHFSKIYHKRYTYWIINYLIDDSTPYPLSDLIFKKAFEGAIQDLLFVTKGIEKNILFQIYKKNGLWDSNLEKLKNPFWYNRLSALIKMDLWQFSLGYERIQHLLYDENDQIRQIAIKNLSRTKDEKEAKIVLDMLSKGHFFYSVQYESIFRLIRMHRELVLNGLKVPEYSKLKIMIIKVIGDSRIIEGVPALLKVGLESVDSQEKELVLTSLGKIGDPRGLDILKKGLSSNHSNERLASLRAIHLLDPDQLKNNMSFLQQDSDTTVRSWYDYYLKGGQ